MNSSNNVVSVILIVAVFNVNARRWRWPESKYSLILKAAVRSLLSLPLANENRWSRDKVFAGIKQSIYHIYPGASKDLGLDLTSDGPQHRRKFPPDTEVSSDFLIYLFFKFHVHASNWSGVRGHRLGHYKASYISRVVALNDKTGYRESHRGPSSWTGARFYSQCSDGFNCVIYSSCWRSRYCVWSSAINWIYSRRTYVNQPLRGIRWIMS